MENDRREKVLEAFHANYDDEFNDLFVWSAALAIIKWLRLEQELKYIEVWRQWTLSIRIIFYNQENIDQWPEHIQQLTSEELIEKLAVMNKTALELANISFNEKDSFRSFVKAIGVSGMGDRLKPEERGDLMTLLQIFLAIANEYEPSQNLDKYNTDINDICLHQLEGENILEEVKSNANVMFQDLKDTLMEEHPIEGIEDSESNEEEDLGELFVNQMAWIKDNTDEK